MPHAAHAPAEHTTEGLSEAGHYSRTTHAPQALEHAPHCGVTGAREDHEGTRVCMSIDSRREIVVRVRGGSRVDVRTD